MLKGSKSFACGFKTTFFQKFLLKPHPNPFLLRFCVLKCGFNQICSKKCIFGPKMPYFFKIFGAFGAETCGFNPIFFAMPCGSGPPLLGQAPPYSISGGDYQSLAQSPPTKIANKRAATQYLDPEGVHANCINCIHCAKIFHIRCVGFTDRRAINEYYICTQFEHSL